MAGPEDGGRAGAESLGKTEGRWPDVPTSDDSEIEK